VDGIVVAGLLDPHAATERLRRLDIPVVETWDLTDRPVDMVVGFSHLKAGSAIAGYFLGRGWRRLRLATRDDQRGLQRRGRLLAGVGREVPTVLVPAPSTIRLGREALGELLAREPQLEAVYCSSDGLAEGMLIEARARGLKVPEQLAVCGFGD